MIIHFSDISSDAKKRILEALDKAVCQELMAVSYQIETMKDDEDLNKLLDQKIDLVNIRSEIAREPLD